MLKYFQMIVSCYHVYPIKMASEVGCTEDFVTDSDIQGDTFISRKKTKAFVWKYFGFETDSNGCLRCVEMLKCRLCQATVAAKDYNMSNLYSHLFRSTCPKEFLLVQIKVLIKQMDRKLPVETDKH